MTKTRTWLLPALLAAAVAAGADLPKGRQALPEAMPARLDGLVPLEHLGPANRLDLAITLPLRRPAALSALLRDLYDPASANYRRFLTPEQFTERFGPSPGDYQALIEFARTNGFTVTRQHPNRTLLNLSASVADIQQALHTTLSLYSHPTEPRTFYAPDSPPSIQAPVRVLEVIGLNNFYRPRPKSLHPAPPGNASPKTGSGPNGTLLGKDFRAAYAPGVTLNGTGQSLALVEFDGYYPNDITAYQKLAGLSNFPPLQNVLLDQFDGTPTTGRNSGDAEVSLDIELAGSMAPGLSTIFVYEAGPFGSAYDVLTQIVTDNSAKQVSCSWDFGTPTQGSIDQIFQEMAGQGQSFFDASGDNGAYSGGIPAPDDDPYITLVGGTTLATGTGGVWSSETVWNWYLSGEGSGASGGGISTSYTIPWWQTGIVMTANQGSTSHRNVPDVAMTADNVWVTYNNGKSGTFGGTSCAAPLWAGFTAMVNQQTMAASGVTLGFLNPAVYAIGKGSAAQYAAGFHDITTGNNFPNTSATRFVAASGYDLCTGWGTPVGQPLINALAGHPDSLRIMPTTGFTSAGAVGGPFSTTSQTFTLTNFGTATLGWAIVNSATWLAVSPASGVLAPTAPATNATVSVTPIAASLPSGVYTATIGFSNVTAGVTHNLQFALEVGQNVVQNGGFETGDFTDWALNGSPSDVLVVSASSVPPHPELVHSGTYGALLGEVGALGYISQTLPTVAGQLYQVSFWVTSPYFSVSDTPNEFLAEWIANTNSPTVLFDQVDLPAFNWTNMQFFEWATAAGTVLEFGGRNDPQAFGLDDVSVVPVSLPVLQKLGLANDTLTLTWTTLPGVAYQFQFTTNLAAGPWNDLGSPLTATNTSLTLSDVSPPDPHRFYRLLLAP